MNYLIFLPASEAKSLKDKHCPVYKSNYLDVRLRSKMSIDESDVVLNELQGTESDISDNGMSFKQSVI